LQRKHDAGIFPLSDTDHKVADAFGVRGKLVGFALDPGQPVQRVITPGYTPIVERAAAELQALRPFEPSSPDYHPPILVISQAKQRCSPEACCTRRPM
jgi:hypothetical protein|tara:strand:- start:597 stop:890 length:294 start_codon:yes stop_codon:yes gene_type:complete